MLTLVWVIVGAIVFALAASFMFTKAASRSPLWNIGFGAALALIAAALLTVGLIFVVRKLFPAL